MLQRVLILFFEAMNFVAVCLRYNILFNKVKLKWIFIIFFSIVEILKKNISHRKNMDSQLSKENHMDKRKK